MSGTSPSRRPTRIRLMAVVAATVFLTMVSTASWAGWSTNVGTQAATAQAGTIGLTTTGISALGPTTYSMSATSKLTTVVVANTGSVPLTISSLAISSSAPALANSIGLSVWAKPAGACAAPAPAGALSTTLASAVAYPSFALPLSGTSLCVLTTFNGGAAALTALAGQSNTTSLSFSANVGTQWIATDSSAPQSFVQSVIAMPSPTATSCKPGPRYNPGIFGWFSSSTVQITWVKPDAATPTGYIVQVTNAVSGVVKTFTTTSTTIVFNGTQLNPGNYQVTVVATYPEGNSAAGTSVNINVDNGGFFTENNVTCR